MDNNMFFGIHPVEELIKAEKEIEKVFVQTGLRSPQISDPAPHMSNLLVLASSPSS